MPTELQMRIGTQAAFAQAQKSYDEGGIPVGSALLTGDTVVSVGHNQRFQKGSNILHGEMDCIERAGHAVEFSKSILFTTLSPCLMCANTILLFKIPTVVILDAENVLDFTTSEERLKREGVEVVIAPHGPSMALNRSFQTANRDTWLGDVGKG